MLGRFTSSGSFEFVSPRSIPKMWLVKVRPTEDYSAVLVDAPGMDQIKIDFPQPDQRSCLSHSSPIIRLRPQKYRINFIKIDPGFSNWSVE